MEDLSVFNLVIILLTPSIEEVDTYQCIIAIYWPFRCFLGDGCDGIIDPIQINFGFFFYFFIYKSLLDRSSTTRMDVFSYSCLRHGRHCWRRVSGRRKVYLGACEMCRQRVCLRGRILRQEQPML